MSEIDTINVHPADAKQWNNKSRKKRQSVVMETNAGEYVFARKTRKESAGKFALLRHGNKAAMWWRKRNGLMAWFPVGRTWDRFIEAATSKGFARTGKWNFHYRNTSHCQ